ncbi:MAG: hypothetical protein DWP98_01460 [Bacteroidetes bacterium]|nr:MAG: hypothetical protein DWP98_01460 [Bacteroidota bacterium]MBL1143827.1 hypothetical protein [Bacteroidota bacterium]
MTLIYRFLLRIIPLLNILFLTNLYAQKETGMFIAAGYNFASLELESKKLNPVPTPFFAINSRIELRGNLYLKPSVSYQRKRSLINSSTDLRQGTVSAGLQVQQKVDDFFFQIGLQMDKNQGRTLVHKTEGLQTYFLKDGQKEGDDLFISIGTEYKATPTYNISIDAYLPAQGSHSSSFQIGIVYKINIRKGDRNKRSISERKNRINHSKKQIRELNSGTLLCRLYTSIPKIEAMKKVGMIEEAAEVEETQRKLNLGIINSFRKNYTYSKVEFFYSYNSESVRNGELSNIFLDDSLNVDSSIIIETSEKLFTVGYQKIDQDSIQIFDQNTYGDGKPPRATYYGGPDFSFNAFVIMTQQFQQLDRPFPYYTRAFAPSFKQHKTMRVLLFPFLFQDKFNFDKAVSKFNKKLTRYKLESDVEKNL